MRKLVIIPAQCFATFSAGVCVFGAASSSVIGSRNETAETAEADREEEDGQQNCEHDNTGILSGFGSGSDFGDAFEPTFEAFDIGWTGEKFGLSINLNDEKWDK